MSVGRTVDIIVKTAVLLDFPEFNLTNGKPQPVANVIRWLRAGSRTMAHYDAHESDRTWTLSESNELIAAASMINISMCKWLPVLIVIGVQMHWIVARPVLNAILCGVRRSPKNADGVDWFACVEIDHYPLQMRVFGFPGEMRIEIRITFPKRIVIAVCDTGIAVIIRLIDGVSSPWQMIAVGDVDRLAKRIV